MWEIEREKKENCQDLKRKVGRLFKLKMIEIVALVIGALGSVTKELIRGKRWKCKEEIILQAFGHKK